MRERSFYSRSFEFLFLAAKILSYNTTSILNAADDDDAAADFFSLHCAYLIIFGVGSQRYVWSPVGTEKHVFQAKEFKFFEG
jgi:hypothetical protein